MSLFLEDVIPTHNQLRDMSSYWFFREKFIQSQSFSCDPITIIETEDEKRYLWDAHHRCAAWVSIGGYSIPENQYRIIRYTYKELAEVNLTLGYVTPFNPIVECRLSDFSFFKNHCLKMRDNKIYFFDIVRYIYAHRNYYSEPRTSNSIKDMLDRTINAN